MTNDEQSEYEAGLRWRLEVLKEQFEAGKIHIAEHVAAEMERSLKAVKYGPDGQIDLSTVDGRVRSMAAGVAAMHNRQAAKDSISLTDLNQTYFEFVERNFRTFADQAKEMRLDADQFAHLASRHADFVAGISNNIPKLIEYTGGVLGQCSRRFSLSYTGHRRH